MKIVKDPPEHKNGRGVNLTPEEEEATKVLKDTFGEEAMKDAKTGTGPPPVAPLQQWADLISKELCARIAPHGFKKHKGTGKVIVNLDFLTRERFINAGESLVHVFNYHVQRLGAVYDGCAKETEHSINVLQSEYDALPFYRFKKRRAVQHNIIGLRDALEAFKQCAKILITIKP